MTFVLQGHICEETLGFSHLLSQKKRLEVTAHLHRALSMLISDRIVPLTATDFFIFEMKFLHCLLATEAGVNESISSSTCEPSSCEERLSNCCQLCTSV